MKLRAPSLIRNIAQLSWQGAVAADDYRRLRVHFWAGGLLLGLIFLAVTAPIAGGLIFFASPAIVTGYYMLAACLLAILSLWWAFHGVKIEVLRLRGLGINGWKALTAIIGFFWLAVLVEGSVSELQEDPELMLTGFVPVEVYRWLHVVIFLKIALALYDYWMYLEETPLKKVTATFINPIKEPIGKLEKMLVFLLQIRVWFEILAMPIYIAMAVVK